MAPDIMRSFGLVLMVASNASNRAFRNNSPNCNVAIAGSSQANWMVKVTDTFVTTLALTTLNARMSPAAISVDHSVNVVSRLLLALQRWPRTRGNAVHRSRRIVLEGIFPDVNND